MMLAAWLSTLALPNVMDYIFSSSWESSAKLVTASYLQMLLAIWIELQMKGMIIVVCHAGSLSFFNLDHTVTYRNP